MTVPFSLPKDLAWHLAEYARYGLARAETAGNETSFLTFRSELDESLGFRYQGQLGERF